MEIISQLTFILISSPDGEEINQNDREPIA